jgi:hypothetical protein
MRPGKFLDYVWAGAEGRMLLWRRASAALVFAAAFACLAQDGHPIAAATGQTNVAQQQKAAQADSERKKQISDESTRLLAMAIALKAEVDKTTKDTLSLGVIRKADEIEKLAKTVKEKMKQGSGPS